MFEGLFQPLHLIVIFFIALLIFGPKKLADLGKGLGQGIREFKDAIKMDAIKEEGPQPALPADSREKEQEDSIAGRSA